MRMIYTYSLIALIAIFSVLSCDKVNDPLADVKKSTPNDSSSVDTSIVYKNILIEDYTGHRCGNCPRAHEALESVIGLYGNRIIPITVHAGFFAMTLGDYSIDYTTEVGDDWDSYFGCSQAGLPNGMINRKELNGNVLVPYASWASEVTKLLEDSISQYKITISNDFDDNTKTLGSTVSINSDGLNNETLFLSVVLIEDKIISIQKDYNLPSPSEIENYEHKHILRTSLNTSWGEQISFSTNSSFSKKYSIVPDAKINVDNSYVVAFIYNGSSKEILQSEMKKITKN